MATMRIAKVNFSWFHALIRGGSVVVVILFLKGLSKYILFLLGHQNMNYLKQNIYQRQLRLFQQMNNIGEI